MKTFNLVAIVALTACLIYGIAVGKDLFSLGFCVLAIILNILCLLDA